MIREDIFNTVIPKTDKVRSLLKFKRLVEEYTNSHQFERKAAIVASRILPANEKIKLKLAKNSDYIDSWQKNCSLMFSYLLGPARFLDRTDVDELICLPFISKIIINSSSQTVRGISVYNSSKRIGTLFFRDPEFNNEFAFFGQNNFTSIGSWVSKVRSDVQNYNVFGLTKPSIISPKTSAAKSSIIESINTVGNTITVHDIFSKIEKLKNMKDLD